MPINALRNFVRSIRGSRSNAGFIGLCVLSLSFFGCTPFGSASQNTATANPIQTSDAYITLQDSALDVHHFTTSTVNQIQASRPQTVVWSQDNDYIAWVEKTDTGSRVVIMDTATQKQEVPYVSNQLITDIALSPRADSIGFLEGRSLFTMTLHGEGVQRIAEDVVEYAWSPNDRTLAVSTADKTELATPSLQSNDIVYADVRGDQPLRGMVFRRADTLVGFVVNTGAELISVDLKTHTSRVLSEWTATANDLVLPVEVASWLSPDGSALMIQETTSTGAHHVTEYTFATDQRVQVPGEARMQGWFGKHDPILLQDFHLTARQGILQDSSELFIEFSEPHAFVRSVTAL